MPGKVRNRELTRQKLEVARVFEQMLGAEEALAYLRREGLIPEPALRGAGAGADMVESGSTAGATAAPAVPGTPDQD